MKNKKLPLAFAAAFFLWSAAANAQDYQQLIAQKLSAAGSVAKSDLQDFTIKNEDRSASMNADVIKFQQLYNGIPVYNAVGTALVKNNSILHLTEDFTKSYTQASSKNAAADPAAVFSGVAGNMQLSSKTSYRLTPVNSPSRNDVHAVQYQLMYMPTDKGNLQLCYEFMFEEAGTSNYWQILADASTGEILRQENLTVSCSFPTDAFIHDHSQHAGQSPAAEILQSSAILKAAAPDNAQYRVFPLPIESPLHGGRQLVSNPWLADASPDGWHRVGGGTYAGAYTTTQGNNVFAYEDTGNNNAPGLFADGGANRVFDFPFVLNATSGNQKAAITNLFYINNRIHDIFYSVGFTETARNFQAYNFGKGGAQNDYVQAEAQDGSGRNNANFATPSDGGRPRMQMYLWDPAVIERVFYNTPPEAVGRVVPSVVSTTFGPTLTATGVTADVKLSPVENACTPLPAGSLTGYIGLVKRGECDFTTKVKNTQVAGAVATIIYSLPDSAPTGGMAGTDNTITIPSVLIDNGEGVYMKNLIESGKNVNITLKYDVDAQAIRDASFDNGIIVHEYGHGISNRLTGNGYGCLSSSSSKEQMGEGWSDFFALMLTNRPGDDASVARGIGTYSTSEAITGNGIRPARYSPDRGINNFTYGNTNGMQYTNQSGQLVPDVHSIGFVWATMLWDLHWKYAEKYGYSSDVTANTTNGSTRVLQLVTDGLKLQACNPTFIDGRNAILQAEMAATNGADKCMIWDVFAKRGLGVNASAGSKTNINDQVEDFDVPAECKLVTSETRADKAVSLYPNPARNYFQLQTAKNIQGKINVSIYDMSGKLVSTQRVEVRENISVQNLSNGVYIVKADGLGFEYSGKLMIKK